VAGQSATNLSRWDGIEWSSVGGGVSGIVETLASSSDGLYVGGLFSEAGGVSASNIARWDGTNWSVMGDGLNNIVFTIATRGREVFAGGHFTASGSVPISRIARWDGTNWTALGSGLVESGAQSFALAIAIQGSNVFVGGSFSSAGGVPASNIARWNGMNWFATGEGLTGGSVGALYTMEPHIYAGGSFRRSGVIPVECIARWDGTSWSEVGKGVTAIKSYSGGIRSLAGNGVQLFAGGVEITEVGNISATNIAAWNGSTWSALGSGVIGPFGGQVYSLLCDGGDVLVGGYFDSVGGGSANHFALWHVPHSLSISQTGNELSLSWPSTGTNYVLEAKGNVTVTNWSEVLPPPVILNNECVVTNTVNGAQRVYRLRRR